MSVPNRPLAPCTVIALEVIAAADVRRLHMADFELWMSQRGCDSREVMRALNALARRGWATVVGSSLNVSEAGFGAATQGVAIGPPQRRPRRRAMRMPSGLL